VREQHILLKYKSRYLLASQLEIESASRLGTQLSTYQPTPKVLFGDEANVEVAKAAKVILLWSVAIIMTKTIMNAAI
jgi:hypothetical protein